LTSTGLLLANYAHLARSSSQPASDAQRSPAIASVPPNERRWFVAEAQVSPEAVERTKALVGGCELSARIWSAPNSTGSPVGSPKRVLRNAVARRRLAAVVLAR